MTELLIVRGIDYDHDNSDDADVGIDDAGEEYDESGSRGVIAGTAAPCSG